MTKVAASKERVFKPLKRQSRLQQATNFAASFLIFEKKQGMIFHENCLQADNSHEISGLILFFFLKKAAKFEIVVCCKM